MDNATFEENPEEELYRIMAEVAAQLQMGRIFGSCFDTNGNKVGKWEIIV